MSHVAIRPQALTTKTDFSFRGYVNISTHNSATNLETGHDSPSTLVPRHSRYTSYKLNGKAVTMLNLLTPNINYSGRTAPLTSKIAFYILIQQTYVLNILDMVYTLRFFLFKMQFVS